MQDALARFWTDARSVGAAELAARLRQHGLVLLDGIDTAAQARRIAGMIGTIRPHRDSAADGVTYVAPGDQHSGEHGYRGFTRQALFPHTDRSVAAAPPPLLLFWCECASARGGDTLLVDGKLVWERMQALNPEALQAIAAADSAVFASDGNYHQGSVFERVAPSRVRIRFRLDQLIYPSMSLLAALPIARGYIEALATTLKLQPGQGYLLQNTRWLHGRTAYCGSRRCGRLHLDALPAHAAELAGFEAAIGAAPAVRSATSTAGDETARAEFGKVRAR